MKASRRELFSRRRIFLMEQHQAQVAAGHREKLLAHKAMLEALTSELVSARYSSASASAPSASSSSSTPLQNARDITLVEF